MDLPDFPDEPFTHEDLLGLGISVGSLRRALCEHRVRRILTGAFVRCDLPDSVELRLAAVRRVVASGHIACDRTAAWLHGVDVFSLAEHAIAPRLELCVLPDRWATRSPAVRGRSRDLASHDIAELGGVRVTTPLRTALDLACNIHGRDALAALDQFDRVHRVHREDLERELPRFRGRRGVVQARVLAPLVDARSESVRESWVRFALIDAGLPRPEVQHWVTRHGRPVYRLDLAYPEHRIAIEYDGEEFHRTADQRAHDEERRAWLRSEGWTIVVVRNGDFAPDREAAWTNVVRQALADRYCNLRW